VEPKPERDAFTRALTYLSPSRKALWGAHLAAAGSGVVVVLLLVILWLFIDLMVSRGRLPSYDELTPTERERFVNDWNSVDFGGQTLGEEKRKAAVELRTGERPEKDPTASDDLTSESNAALWQAYEEHLLVHVYQLDDNGLVTRAHLSGDPVAANLGAWSLVVRSHINNNLSTSVLARVVRWNPWMRNAYFRVPGLNLRVREFYLLILFLLAFVLAVAGAGLTLLNREMAARAVIAATTRLRQAVYRHTFRLGTLAFRNLGPSEALSLFTRHLETLHEALYARLTVLFREPILFGLILAFALVANVYIALAFLGFAVLVWFLGGQAALAFGRKARQATREAGEQLAVLRESLTIMRLVKCTTRIESFNQARVERQLNHYAELQRVRHRGESLARPVLVLLAMLAALILLFVAGLLILTGNMDPAAGVAMATALVSLYRPVEKRWEGRRVMRRGAVAADHIFRFLERRPEVGQVVNAELLQPLSRELDFLKVSLREPGTNRMLLDDVTFRIPAGKRVGLIGADDTEKHALVYLIPRLLDPTSGEIRIDERNLRWVTLDSLRVQLAVVLQHNLVFHDSVANNIGCGDPDYKLPDIVEAAKLAHAHQFIQKLPQGYETQIGELGHALPLAQQFLIALARAILRKPALLIIEEPTGELDETTKDLLDDTLARVQPGRTVLFLPHRISTIRSCDTLFLLQKGRVVAHGTHKELLANNPLYRHLHYLEFNEMDEN
jgi:ATP-binding cassette, subfamily B, bacterial